MFNTSIRKNLKARLTLVVAACCLLCTVVTFMPAASAHAASVKPTGVKPNYYPPNPCSSYQTELSTNVHDSQGAYLGTLQLDAGYCNNEANIWGVMNTFDGTLAQKVEVYVEYTNKPGYLTYGWFSWPDTSSAIPTPSYHDMGTDFYAEVNVIDYYGKSIWAGTGNICAFC